MIGRTRTALLLCLSLGTFAVACGSDTKTSSTTAAPVTTAAPSSTTGSAEPAATSAPAPSAAETTAPDNGTVSGKIGFITKFPVDFYDIMVDAAKAWAADHADVEVVFAQGKSGTDDEGEIAAIESMITQGVNAIAITPRMTSTHQYLDNSANIEPPLARNRA